MPKKESTSLDSVVETQNKLVFHLGEMAKMMDAQQAEIERLDKVCSGLLAAVTEFHGILVEMARGSARRL